MSKGVSQTQWVKVWDPVVRLFHWFTVILFAAAYGTAEWGYNEIHLIVGYTLTVVLLTRLLWGFVGSYHARFLNFYYSPARMLRYIRLLRQGKPEHYLGHNPLGAAMVFLLLGLLTLISASGLLLAAALEYEGPFLYFNRFISDAASYGLLKVHEIAVYVTILCIGMHLIGVWTASKQHDENLVYAMFTGKKISAFQKKTPPFEGTTK